MWIAPDTGPVPDTDLDAVLETELIRLGFERGYPRLIGVPAETYFDRFVPAVVERARASFELARDFYGAQESCDAFPHWRAVLGANFGFWPELCGQLGDPFFARLHGAHIAWHDSDDGVHQLSCPQDGDGVLPGLAASTLLARRFESEPERGRTFFRGGHAYARWLERLRALSHQYFGSARRHTMVVLDQSYRSGQAVRGREVMINPPVAVHEDLFALFGELEREHDVAWLSLVDDRGRLQVDDDVLYVWDEKRTRRRRVDVLINLAPLDCIDPEHQPLLRRNIGAHRERLNRTAEIVGIRGLVRAWCKRKQDGFIWVNSPVSQLTRSRLTAFCIDEWITHCTGRAPLAPAHSVVHLLDRYGALDRDVLSWVESRLANLILKGTMGEGQSESWFGNELRLATWRKLRRRIELSPGSLVAEPMLARFAELRAPGTRGGEVWGFDLRLPMLTVADGERCDFLAAPFPLCKMTPFDRARARGHLRALAVPVNGLADVRALPALDDGMLSANVAENVGRMSRRVP